VALDSSARAEAALLRSGLPYLTPIDLPDPNWRLWIVTDYPGLVSGPAKLTEFGVDSLAVNFTQPGVATVLVHYTPLWGVSQGTACVFKAAGGWTGILTDEPGPVRLDARRLSVDGLTHASELDCPPDQRVH
jgi:hypothetical protein